VEQARTNGTMTRSDLMGPRTALVYASASAYAATNWAFLIGDKENALNFPYTAPSAVPGEVTIQFGITGPYLSFLSGANAGIEVLWQAATLLINDQCDRALILGVDTFMECEDLYASGRWLLSAPLVEAATCLILERHAALTEVGYSAGSCDDELVMIDTLLNNQATTTAAYLCLPTARDGHRMARRLRERRPDLSISVVSDRVGTCLACTPLVGLLLSMAEEKQGDMLLVSRWWDTWSMLRWPVAVNQTDNNGLGKES
jgi:hypothetical protein